MKGSGCNHCPVNQWECDAQYRGSRCAELRAKAGIESDPKTNADRIRNMSDEQMATELLPMFEELCESGVPSPDYMRWWLKQPAEEA